MKRGRQKPPIEQFLELSDAQKDEAVREFDQEFIADTFRPLTPKQRALWERAKRKRGRPRVGAGSKAISVTIEKSLLRKVDRFAKRHKTTRARLIASGLLVVLAADRRQS